MANKYFRALALFLMLFKFGEILAQPVPPCPDCPTTPVDGGIVGLLILGVGYAVKKIHDHSKK